jgi:hypothetical protein
MDKHRIVEALGLVPGGSFSITDIQMVQWGRDLIFACVYQTVPDGTTLDEPVRFHMVFMDCREIRYKVYAHIGAAEGLPINAIADVVDLALGDGNHRRPANILTNHFSVSVSYGELRFEYNKESFYPSD